MHHPDMFRLLLLLVFRIGLALVWLSAGFAKLPSPKETRETVRRLVPLPAPLVKMVATVLPPGEILLGVVLLMKWRLHLFAGLSAGLFLLFAVLIAAAGIRGALAEDGCGCFGRRAASQRDPAVLTGKLFARNLILALLAFLVAHHG